MTLEQNLGRLTLDRLQGVGTRMPWTCAAFLLGGLGLVGFPLSAGFAGHWAALQLVAASDWLPAAIVLFASAGAIVAFIRQARAMFGAPGDPYIPREGTTGVVVAAIALLASFSLAIAPQMLNSAVTRAIIAFGG
jgi:multicomponent Na+:H+ antiporter subunit D